MRHVALLIDTAGSYGRGLLRGVARYNRSAGGWSTYLHPFGLGDPPPPWLATWHGDGILARLDTRVILPQLLRARVPVVNLRLPSAAAFPYVGPDNIKIGQLAAEHLMERGLRHFGYVGRGIGLNPVFDQRCDGFRAAIEAAGHTCDVFPANGDRGGPREVWEPEQLSKWVAKLPRPVGILAANDERGLRVLDACRRCGAAVPDEVAVIGVDNDEFLCELSIPGMSSIDVNPEQIGFLAAQLLDDLMRGRETAPPAPRARRRNLGEPAEMHLVPPRGVVVRLSTDTVASDDDEVNRAIRYIRERGCTGLRVSDVLAHTGASRASLQLRIKQVIGRTIHEEIERVRLDRVKELLLRPEMTIKQVARAAGFSSVQYMTRVFRNTMGETPARYRSQRHQWATPAGEARPAQVAEA